MPGDTSASSNTADDTGEVTLAQVLAAVKATQVSLRHTEGQMIELKSEIANLKAARPLPAATNQTYSSVETPKGPSVPDFPPVSALPTSVFPYTPMLRPGTIPGTAVRPGETPSTPKARGVSGFFVPRTPKRTAQSPTPALSTGSEGLRSAVEQSVKHMDKTLSAHDRIEASRLASDENSPEIQELKSMLWTTCLGYVQQQRPDATEDEVVAETDTMCSQHWLQLRKDRIVNAFANGNRKEAPKDATKAANGEKSTRRISQTASARVSKLTHDNYMEWVSEIYSIVSCIPYGPEILEGVEFGEGYDYQRPSESTEGYDLWLDLEIGGLIGGSVSSECRGYVFARQAAGEFRGSVIWRDLAQVMQRADGLGKAAILEKVLAERQKSSEGVRPYAERMRAHFIKSSAIGKPFTNEDQVLYFLRGLQQNLSSAKDTIRGFQSNGSDYSFDQALRFLITIETAAIHDAHASRIPLLARPVANLASASGSAPRRFHILRNTAVKGQPGYFNGECRHCHKWGHKQDDCAERKRDIDSGAIKPDQASAKLAQIDEDEEIEAQPETDDMGSDTEGEIFELVDENGDTFYARLATGPVGNGGEARLASAMMATAGLPTDTEGDTEDEVYVPKIDREALARHSIPRNAVKWILDSGATHHMTSRSELLPMRVGAHPDTWVHIADGTRAKVTRKGACIADLFGDGNSSAIAALKTVLVVPSFTSNLLSVQRLAEDGWRVSFTKHGAELLSPKGEKVQTFTEPGTGAPYLMLKSQPKLFIDIKGAQIRSGPAKATARIASTKEMEDAVLLWHRRMAHLSFGSLRTLTKDPAFQDQSRPDAKAVTAIMLKGDVCDPCVETKQPSLPFDDTVEAAAEKLDRIAFDLMGPFEGNKEYKYAYSKVDEFSRMTWVHCIPNKEAATVFAVFEAWPPGCSTCRPKDTAPSNVSGAIMEASSITTSLRPGDSRTGSPGNGQHPTPASRTVSSRGTTAPFRTVQEQCSELHTSAMHSGHTLSAWPARSSTGPRRWPSKDAFHLPCGLEAPSTTRTCACSAASPGTWVVKPVKTRQNKLTVRAVRGTYLGKAPGHKASLVYTPAERPFLRISRHVIFDESRTYDARFTLDQKQAHDGTSADVLDLIVPGRKVKLSDIPVEADAEPLGAAVLDMSIDEQEDWDATVENVVATEQQRGNDNNEWPTLDGLFGADDQEEDLAVDEWTGELGRHSTPGPMPPSVYGIRNSYPSPNGLGSPLALEDLDDVWLDTPTKTRVEPTVGAITEEVVPPRRSSRLQGQFKALTSSVNIALQAVHGEEEIRAFAAQAFEASVRSSADGVLIEPKTLAEAKKRDDWSKWEEGMNAEIESLKSMHTWDLVDLPPGRKAIGCRWTYKLKLDADGNAARWKSRLVAQGFSQRAGVDYGETFAPVARLTTVRVLIALAIRHGLTMWSMDVVTAYLNGSVTEDIYMIQPPHYEDGTKRVCKLKRSLYGLKQSGREWFSVVASWLKSQSFKALKSEPCVFHKVTSDGEPVVIVLYVDDVIISAKRQSTIDEIRKAFTDRFKMTDNGLLTQVLGLKINLNHETGLASISQEAYVKGMIRRFGLEAANPVDSPMTAALQALGPRTEGQATKEEVGGFASIIGSLMWGAQGTRPDIAYAVFRLARFMANPRPEHIIGAKRILRYLLGTSGVGLVYTSRHNAEIEGFCDADHSKDLSTRRSVSGYAFFVHGNLVSWRSRLQATVAISSTESEYMAMSEAAREAKWLRTITTELDLAPRRATDIFTDSSGAYSLARNPEGHNRLKHIDTHYHYVRELVEFQQINVTQIGTNDNAADIFTKVTSVARLHDGMLQLGVGDHHRQCSAQKLIYMNSYI
ncbi:hypothetical protein CF326_g6985 [Tilletia indica]|nr:hypothetical protein CF326_g6985 [Tilletia indica]